MKVDSLSGGADVWGLSSALCLILTHRRRPDPDLRDAEETHCRDGWSGQYVLTFRTNAYVKNPPEQINR